VHAGEAETIANQQRLRWVRTLLVLHHFKISGLFGQRYDDCFLGPIGVSIGLGAGDLLSESEHLHTTFEVAAPPRGPLPFC
jgi:hypothetical protein